MRTACATPLLADASAYAIIGILMLLLIVGVVAILILTHLVGRKRRGPVKDSTYESGMPVIGDARKRFNVRFYVVAMLFLLFDVEVVFLWPWAPVFHEAATTGQSIPGSTGDPINAGFMLAAMGVFAGFLVIGFIYEWRRGMFQWD